MSNKGGGRRFLPAESDYEPTDGDFLYAGMFDDLAGAVEACEGDAERVALMLSTCRNQWMTVNAMFVDLQRALAASGARPDFATAAFWALQEHGSASDDAAEDHGLRQLERARRHAHTVMQLMSQVRTKLDVWRDRTALKQRFSDALPKPPGISADRMAAWYELQQLGVRAGIQRWQQRYIALDMRETDPGIAWMAFLERCERTVTLAMHVVTHAVGLLDGDGSSTQHEPHAPPLFVNEAAERALVEEQQETWEHLREKLAAGGDQFGAEIERDEDGELRLRFSDGSRLLLPPALPGPEALKAMLTALLEVAQKRVRDTCKELDDEFSANVAETPLPAPYVVDLTTKETPSGRRDRDFEVSMHFANAEPGRDRATVALLECPMPEEMYSHAEPDHYVYDRERGAGARIAKHFALAALDTAKEEGADLLIMPEVFLPRGVVDEIEERAKHLQVGLVAGAEYPQAVGNAINEAIVVLPTLGKRLQQRKQAPSVYEVRQAAFEHDDVLHVIRRTPFGTLVVVVCSDYLELDHVGALASLPYRVDLLVVCSRNPHPEVFGRLAAADAARLHAYVAIANAHPGSPQREGGDGALLHVQAPPPTAGGAAAATLEAAVDAVDAAGTLDAHDRALRVGTLVAQPNASDPFLPLRSVSLPPSPDGGPTASVLLGELDIAGLRGRDRERAKHGFLRPPRFAQWQRDVAR